MGTRHNDPILKDPTADPYDGKGSVRGHLLAGAEKVLVSAPFKTQAKGLDMPENAITTVIGINDDFAVSHRAHASRWATERGREMAFAL